MVQVTPLPPRREGLEGEDTLLGGTWKSVNWVGNTFRRADLSAAELLDCAMIDSKEEDIRLPNRPTNFAIRPDVFAKAEPELQRKLERASFEVYRRLAGVFAQLGPAVIISEDVLEQLEPPDRRVVMATLFDLRRS
jgi:hypothetical protein